MLKPAYTIALFLYIFFLSVPQITGQELKAYQLFDNQGNAVHFGQLTTQSVSAEVVLFGELHNNPISHWLQLELLKALHQQKEGRLVLGMEMFEADNQLLIDEYFQGLIATRNFESEARLWNNYSSDIKPLVEYARENQIALIATNIPRRYAAMVNREGFEGLEKLGSQALSYVVPLPVAYDPELPGYKAMLEMTGMPAHTSENFPKAQAIKDATMAHFILSNLKPHHLFLHVHGAYHSNNYEGIVWYLRRSNPDINLVTISTVEQEDTETLLEEHKGIADFIIVVPVTMTKTY